ncbi:MAG: VanZ family protein [Phycisphaerae bacterium]|nr:VanZ family protein [Phycisphaerae bacterium]MDW8262601.1 VanZ family protein [Phycisphaerales bacterium]
MTTPQDRTPRGSGWLGPVLALYWLALFAVTHLPQAALPKTHLGDKLEHFLAYAVLGGLLTAWMARRRARMRHPMVVALITVLGYAAIDELTQPVVNRHADLRDWLADAIGAAVGVGVSSIVLYFCHRRQG